MKLSIAIPIAIAVAALLCAGAIDAVAQEAEIGMVKTLQGGAYVLRGDQRNPAKIGDRLFQGDRLETGADGAMGVTFVDDTTLSLGPKSQIVLTKFVFDPNRSNYGFVSKAVSGTFMFVSGQIAKLSPQTVAVETPVGNIGIRGTRFLVKVEP